MSDPVGNIPRGELSGNSHRSRQVDPPVEAREPAEKIVEGKVVVKKPSLLKRIAHSMLAEDVSNVGDFVVTDVIGPAIRNLIYDIVVQGTGRTLFGQSRNRRITSGAVVNSGPVSTMKTMTSYHRVGESEGPGRPVVSRQDRATHNFDPFILENRAEALGVIEAMAARVIRYGFASVSDLYDFVGETPDFTMQRWGWTNLDDAGVRQVRDGFLLDLPAPISLRS